LQENESSSGVSLKRRFISFSGSTPRLRSSVILRPPKSVSSRISEISRSLEVFTSSITLSIIASTVAVGGISVISMHTNLDMGDGGVNDALCEKIGLKNITKITDSEGFILRKGEIAPLPCDALAKQIREALGGAVKYSDNGKEIRNVLVCSGSGGDYIYLAKELGLDALITADVKHNIFTTAANLDIAVFDAGHFDTEDVIVDPLCKLLSEKFKDLTFIPCHYSRIKSI